MDNSTTPAPHGESGPSIMPLPWTNWPPIIGYDGLSLLLGRTVATLQADRIRRPESLPPASTPAGTRNPLWVTVDVIEWIRAMRHSGPNRQPNSIRKPCRGAPTKAERIAAQAAGYDSVAEYRAAQRSAQGESA